MKNAPLILLSPSTQAQGVEFSDLSISLSNRYSEAILAGGGVPWILPCAPRTEFITECVRRADGLLLTGGSDAAENAQYAAETFPLAPVIRRVFVVTARDAPLVPGAIEDCEGLLAQRYDARPGTVYLLRPDGHVAARWRMLEPARVCAAMARAIGKVGRPQ